MKRKLSILVLALAATFAVSTSAFAAYPGGFGIGLSAGSSYGMQGFGGANVNLSLKFPGMPALWTVGGNFGSIVGVSLLAQFPVWEMQLIKGNLLALTFNPGIGGSVWLGNDIGLTLYGYAPIGLRCMPADFIEIFLDLGIQLGAVVIPPVNFLLNGAGYGGIRFWF